MKNYPNYEFLKQLNIVPFISLDSKTKAKFNYPHPDGASCDDKGHPVCKGDKPFAYWGFCQPYRLKYRCCHDS